jgi:hypothetical protein
VYDERILDEILAGRVHLRRNPVKRELKVVWKEAQG